MEKGGYALDQAVYAMKLLKSFGLDSCNPSPTPGDPDPHYEPKKTKVENMVEATEDGGEMTADIPKKMDGSISTATREALKLTGALLWLTTRTRLDMALVTHRSAKHALNDPDLSTKIGKKGPEISPGFDQYVPEVLPGPQPCSRRTKSR